MNDFIMYCEQLLFEMSDRGDINLRRIRIQEARRNYKFDKPLYTAIMKYIRSKVDLFRKVVDDISLSLTPRDNKRVYNTLIKYNVIKGSYDRKMQQAIADCIVLIYKLDSEK